MPQNYKEAIQWLHKAIKQCLSYAQLITDTFYCDGKGIPLNNIDVLKWFRKSQGHKARLS